MSETRNPPDSIAFADPARAERHFGAVSAKLGSEDLRALPPLLSRSADPDEALDLLARFLDHGPDAVEILAGDGRRLHAALTLFSHSRFLSDVVLRYPELLAWALESEQFDRVISADEMRSELGAIRSDADDADAALHLARFKRMQLLRIALRDLLGEADLAQATLELSNLADALIEGARDHIQGQLVRRFGRPLVDADGAAIEGRFVVLALGKLGGRELNYSSDIDLLYLHTGDGQTAGPIKISNHEFYKQLATRLTALLSQMTSEGFAYRVDLRLRPEGGAGELVIPLDGAVNYYHNRARDWELQMLIKARPVAGHLRLGRGFLSMVQPLIYSTTTDFSTIEKVSESRDRIQEKLRRNSRGRIDVKLARGGIRDVEFLVQCLQRLHGGRDPFVRSGGSLFALHRLHEKGYLSMSDFSRLSEAYQYFRTLEHRLQLVDNRQTHELPSNPAALRALERKMHSAVSLLSSTDGLLSTLHAYFKRVAEIYERIIRSHEPTETIASVAADAVAEPEGEPRKPPAAAAPDLAWRDKLQRFEQEAPDLAASIAALPIRRGAEVFGRFLDRLGESPQALTALRRSPPLLRLVADLVEHSPYLGEHLVRHPDDVRELVDVAEETGEEDRDADIDRELRSLDELPEAGPLFDPEVGFDDKSMLLRRIYRRRMLRLLADSVYQGRPVFASLARTSDIAEWVVRSAYHIALEELQKKTPRRVPEARLQIVALGRLGMREFDLGSDADLVYVLPDEAREDAPWWTQFVAKMVEVISSYSAEGVIFSVDARLRPRGRDGELVQTEAAFRSYFEQGAETWEAMAYMKARTVAGDIERGKRFLAELQEIAWKRYGLREGSTKLLTEMRVKLEVEQGRKSPLKAGPGGYYDIDFILFYLRLKSAGIFFEYLSTPQRIDLLRTAGEVTDDQAEFLKRAATFFRALDHAVRTATGESSSAVPEEQSVQEAIRELLARWSAVQPSTQPLPRLVDEMRRQTRTLYQQVFDA